MVCQDMYEPEPEMPPMVRRRASSAALVSGLVHEFEVGELEAKYDVATGKPLGAGRCGSVCEVTRRCDGARFAMKRVTMRSMDAGKFEELRSEIRLQKKLDHPNIAKIIETYADEAEGCMLIVMELCTVRLRSLARPPCLLLTCRPPHVAPSERTACCCCYCRRRRRRRAGWRDVRSHC